MTLSIFKLILSSQIALSATATTTSLATSFNTSQEDREYQVESMMNLIKSKSKILSTDEIFQFQNQEFYGREEMDKYIFENNLIQEQATSSNLNKIIKDHQNNILDKDKIYGTDLDDFELIYRDAFGNAQSSREKSLNSYTNKGLVRQKYSYDYEGWFDSPTEAKDNFVFKQGLEKSLYYQVDQRYYNLFNLKDQEELKSSFLDGYYLKPSNFTSGEKVFGDNQKVESSIYNKFRNAWTSSERFKATPEILDNLNYQDYINFDTENTVSITPYNGILISIDGVNYSNTVKLKVDSKYDASYLSKRSNYKAVPEHYFDRSKMTYSINLKNQSKTVKLTFLPKDAEQWTSDVNFGQMAFNDNHNSNITLYSKKYSSSEENISQYKIFEINDLNYKINSNHDIRSQDVLNLYAAWFPYFVKNELLDFKDVVHGQFNKYGVKRDYLYDINGRKGYEYSLSDGIEYYHKFVKPELYKNFVGTDVNGNSLYKVNSNFDATSQELENYMYLQGKQDIRLMFTFTGERNHSSINGLSLASTQAEAQEKLFQIEKSILSKKYFAYDVYGNFEISGNNEDDAIRKLQQKIDLQARYVHKDEIKNWNNQTVSFENIISDGVYTTYRTFINGEWTYFLNHHDAYNALTGNVTGETVVKTRTVNLYMYIENNNNEKITHTYSTDAELEDLANKILGYVS
ncbi:hypothetical protein SSABA_v1c03620 [Spiroplasma sabaudiense Ar-1343]|uniref:Uncharacterized protein n=1 Tax=Spiroplasma sabaudiense Ar-1343 TaxID=1276257 RepID=W6A9W7_9MOLU|nr:hypothetical protein [Spiroplasma sabaudiense]AHI53771.1 hypothetical protein SSABA_v1c03620 [Spiroplasma sabaudiense Ar-1343]